MKKFVLLMGVVSVAVLSACSSTSQYRGVYEEVEMTAPLEVPPGLDTPADTGAALPELNAGSKSYSEYANKGTGNKRGYLPSFNNMRFVRDGSIYWLELKDYPENVWPDVRSFFSKLGFKMTSERPQVGLMQTEWKENRQDLPTGWLLSWIGSLTSNGLLDRYSIRIEFDEEKVVTRVFISHRGLREIVEGEETTLDVIQTKWVPRPPDSGLEIELLMRYMIYRGADEMLAKNEVKAVKGKQRFALIKQNETTALQVNEIFSRTWRHVGLALDRMGVLVEDRNRSAGVYYIKLPETFEINDSSGFFSGLYTSTKKPSSDTYILTVENLGETTRIMVKPRGEVGKDLPLVVQKILGDIQSNIL